MTNNEILEIIHRKKDIITAIKEYCKDKDKNITHIAMKFGVSENTIAQWFFAGIAQRYIESDELCTMLINKHIHEYESTHCITGSSLRLEYNLALDERKFHK